MLNVRRLDAGSDDSSSTDSNVIGATGEHSKPSGASGMGSYAATVRKGEKQGTLKLFNIS